MDQRGAFWSLPEVNWTTPHMDRRMTNPYVSRPKTVPQPAQCPLTVTGKTCSKVTCTWN